MNGRDLLNRFLGRHRGPDRPDEPPPLPRAPRAKSGPVEHGPTKAPFSRERRRLRSRAASRSRMRSLRR